MTTEEKAKAYEMALEAAREELKQDLHESGVWAIKRIFPQLRESEDERIRKCLIHYLRGEEDECKFNIPDMLAWLEKQKERGPLTKEEEYILHRIIEYLEDETCPSEWINLLHDIYCLPYEKQKDQKPVEWSEADKLCVSVLESFVASFIDYIPNLEQSYRSNVKKGLQLIQSLRHQPKQEWSEEDEKMLKCCLIAINHYEKTCNIGDHLPTKFNIDGYLASVDKVKSWLKSLRPSWKPSEEQIKALEGSIEIIRLEKTDSLIATVLESLYEQLKKL